MKHILKHHELYRNILLILIMSIIYYFVSDYVFLNNPYGEETSLTFLRFFAALISILFYVIVVAILGFIFMETTDAVQHNRNGCLPIYIRGKLLTHWLFYLLLIVFGGYWKTIDHLYYEFYNLN